MNVRNLARFLSVLLIAAMPVGAQTLGPRSAEDLVTLSGSFLGSRPGCGGYPNAFPVDRRVLSDGTEASGWTVPAGSRLVITGVDWVIASPGALSGGNDTIFVRALSGSAHGVDLFTDIVPPGREANAVVLSGIVIDAGSRLCVLKSGYWDFATASIRGYLVEDRGGRR